MANEAQHIDQAVHNMDVIAYLIEKDRFRDWTATVTFYTALHIVEAVFFQNTKHTRTKHGHNHEDRENILKGNRSFKKIYENYSPLQSSSIIAR